MNLRTLFLQAHRMIVLLILFGGGALSVRGSIVTLNDPSVDFANLGKQPNICIGGVGVCFAASAINSFIFLENQYPATYDNKLTPNVVGAKPNQTDPIDTTSFANAILANFPNGLPDDLMGWNAFLAEKKTWINSAAPRTTVFDSFYVGSTDHNGLPPLAGLSDEIQAQEDVELFVSGGGVAHAIVLTGISCQQPPLTGCTMTYQDPNAPTTQQSTALTTGAGGVLQFMGLPGSGFTDTTFTIDAAFAESPVPEPVFVILLFIAMVSIAGCRTWKKHTMLR